MYLKLFCRESWMTRLDDDKFEYKKEQEVPQSISELNHTSEMVRLLEINASPGRKIIFDMVLL